MVLDISKTAVELGEKAAKKTAELLNKAISEKGCARLVLSTGMSQFETISALVKEDVDWSVVEVFHLDEYVGMSIDHPASFRRYILDRFNAFVNVKKLYLVNGEGDVEANIAELTKAYKEAPIDVALIGIGENAHIAFNDPPADFDRQESYITVNLNETCRQQQLNEGWFPNMDAVPRQAISMTVSEIMRCRSIVSAVPHKAKAEAIKNTMACELTNMVPATMLKQHGDWYLYIDENSASLMDR